MFFVHIPIQNAYIEHWNMNAIMLSPPPIKQKHEKTHGTSNEPPQNMINKNDIRTQFTGVRSNSIEGVFAYTVNINKIDVNVMMNERDKFPPGFLTVYM